MAHQVVFYDKNKAVLRLVRGRADPQIAQMWLDFVTDALQERGLLVQAEMTTDDLPEQAWPNFREFIEELTTLVRQQPCDASCT